MHFDAFIDILTYSYDSAGTGRSHARGNPDSDGFVGSQDADVSAEKAGHKFDDPRSSLANAPELDDAGLHSPAPSTQLSEEESSQEPSERESGNGSVQTGSKIAKSKRRRTSSSATETSSSKKGSSKSQGAEVTEDSQPKRKSQRLGDTSDAHRTRSVSGKGGLQKK